MIDLHTHILPQMDDGSKSAEESAQMLYRLAEQGVDTVAATPHFYAMYDNPEAFLRRREEAFARLEYDPEKAPRILSGAEVRYFDGMSRCQELTWMQLGDSGLLLVEMPTLSWTERIVEEVCLLQNQLGLTPVLAHVERYKRQMQKCGRQLLDSGVLLQCNAEVFLSPLTRRKALKMLQYGYIRFLGSDCHNLTTRPPNLAEGAKVIAEKLGKEVWDAMDAQGHTLLKL